MNYIKESEIFKALGHPVRLKMVEGLLQNQCNVTKIVEKLNLPQSTVSQHLGILRKAGIISPEKTGTKICYQVSDKKVKEILKFLNT